ncbi:MAG TPA: hypothetical protein PKI46_05940 [Bacteroidales bacterium]|nr:hypothetical protein [Bacteroidales bacterium]
MENNIKFNIDDIVGLKLSNMQLFALSQVCKYKIVNRYIDSDYDNRNSELPIGSFNKYLIQNMTSGANEVRFQHEIEFWDEIKNDTINNLEEFLKNLKK